MDDNAPSKKELDARTFKVILEEKLAKTKTTKTKFWEMYIKQQHTDISYSYLMGMLSGYGTLRDDVKKTIIDYPEFSTDKSINFLEKIDSLVNSGKLKNYSRDDNLLCVYFPDALRMTKYGKIILKELKKHPRFIEHGRAMSVPGSKTIRVTVFSCCSKYLTLRQAYDKARDGEILFDELTENWFIKDDIGKDITVTASLSIRWIIKQQITKDKT